MSRHTLNYNGIDLSTFGAYVSGENAWIKPAPEFETVNVPGRSGDVLLYNGRYSNISIPYTMGIINNFDSNYNGLIATLLSEPGYHKLVDSSHPGVYRMAAVDSVIEPEMTRANKRGQFVVTFNCKPQVYLDSGDTQIQVIQNSSWYVDGKIVYIDNPTGFAAWPVIIIEGYGDLRLSVRKPTAGGTTAYYTMRIKVLQHTGTIYFDTETGNAEDGSGNNMNQYIELMYQGNIVSKVYPIYGYGQLTAYTGTVIPDTITNVWIIPRFWRL